jgi:hypothetical protein
MRRLACSSIVVCAAVLVVPSVETAWTEWFEFGVAPTTGRGGGVVSTVSSRRLSGRLGAPAHLWIAIALTGFFLLSSPSVQADIPSDVSVTCSPYSLTWGQWTTCTATVTDPTDPSCTCCLCSISVRRVSKHRAFRDDFAAVGSIIACRETSTGCTHGYSTATWLSSH